MKIFAVDMGKVTGFAWIKLKSYANRTEKLTVAGVGSRVEMLTMDFGSGAELPAQVFAAFIDFIQPFVCEGFPNKYGIETPNVLLLEHNPFNRGKWAGQYNWGFSGILTGFADKYGIHFEGINTMTLKSGVLKLLCPDEKIKLKKENVVTAVNEKLGITANEHESHAIALLVYYLNVAGLLTGVESTKGAGNGKG